MTHCLLEWLCDALEKVVVVEMKCAFSDGPANPEISVVEASGCHCLQLWEFLSRDP